ncbi:relaxase domain-containing protein [Nocardia cyriacigeorgica]|uniref:MobF family relaxase n=1 Tax=Nocardia cyriacigeorgica TaxID=135487 RepID=UPI0018944387|nr:MobF family relaxase [Nocardia cyriacigeorgica]MBF6426065.1 relaxase domain-containing protein [Nocardia cyriacigeorgica]
MTATLHKVAAGNGYEYYLRQIAAHDESTRGRTSLADYYTTRGESPGSWWGTGLPALGLSVGQVVTEDQMEGLFGLGRHPDTIEIEARVIRSEIRAGATDKQAMRAADLASRLGVPFRLPPERSAFRTRCADAYTEHNIARGLDPRSAVPDEVRAEIRTNIATAMFADEFGRPPLNSRELSGWVARASRPKSRAVAGFDITFSPVKSVSALWALAPRLIAERIEAAHQAAIDDALGWLERNALFTRLGRNGVRQVEVEGIIAARFQHRDSRAGDPDLHTHVLIANRVRTLDGRWRTVDGQPLHRAVVTVSEIYNTRLEDHLHTELGLEFTERTDTDPAKRPIREIIGIPAWLVHRWSKRDAAITRRLDELATEFQQRWGREPAPSEMHTLADEATLLTRPAKHHARSLADQRQDWFRETAQWCQSPATVTDIVTTALHPPRINRTEPTSEWIAETAQTVIDVVSTHRSTWQTHHVRAEIERQIRGRIHPDQWRYATEAILTEALSPGLVIARGDPDIAAQPDLAHVPPLLSRSNGTGVYTSAGATTYTSPRVLSIERELIDLSLAPGTRTLSDATISAAVSDYNNRHPTRMLNDGQRAVVTAFATSPLQILTANAPAGTGKTTAMQVLTDAWTRSGGTVLGLAPTAAAAAVLGESIGARVETVDKLLHTLAEHAPKRTDTGHPLPPPLPEWVLQIDDRTLVIVDEHVKIGSAKRLGLLRFLTARGATIRCIGDDQQLPAIEAGGADTDMHRDQQPITLSNVVRFADPGEARASLRLRDGDPTALGWYYDNERIHTGHHGAATDQAFRAWAHDDRVGRHALMLAATHDQVADLNARARAHRLNRQPPVPNELTVVLADGLHASAGDAIRTCRNHPKLRLDRDDWVRNSDTWNIDVVHSEGALTVTRLRDGKRTSAPIVLPAEYVAEYVRLGYATTIDSAQGLTADTCHVTLTGSETRQQLYVALTRGVIANHAYLTTALDGDPTSFLTERATTPPAATDIFIRMLNNDGRRPSAHTYLRDSLDPFQRIGRAVDIYLDTIGLAAEHALGADGLARLDIAAEAIQPGPCDAPAYPVLRQHLAVLALTGNDPTTALRTAAAERELDTADDAAAVLDWRLDTTGHHNRVPGPLPWLLGPSVELTTESDTTQVRAREAIVTSLADQIRSDAHLWNAHTAPTWAQPLLHDRHLVADLAIWRAVHDIADNDPNTTGPPRYPAIEREYQAALDQRIQTALDRAEHPARIWAPLAEHIDTRLTSDPTWPAIATCIDNTHHAGIDIADILTTAARQRPLPDDYPAAALWSRLPADVTEAPSAADAFESPGQPTSQPWDTNTAPSDGAPPERIDVEQAGIQQALSALLDIDPTAELDSTDEFCDYPPDDFQLPDIGLDM